MIYLKESEFRRLVGFIKDNYGINLEKKKTLIEGRLNNLLIEKGFKNFSEYIDYVFSDTTGKEIVLLINKLTTNHTYFMREQIHFDFFRDKLLPYLEATVKDKDLRIWSAGCSTGEEPYTLAMTLSEYFGDKKSLWNTKILATDISHRVLETAQNGVYSEESLASIPKEWRNKFFRKIENEKYLVSNEIRNEAIFRIFNLMEESFPFKKKFHVIFCRNVMIYFDSKTKMELINKFYEMTELGGYLFIGHSESIDRSETKYNNIMPSVYRKG